MHPEECAHRLRAPKVEMVAFVHSTHAHYKRAEQRARYEADQRRTRRDQEEKRAVDH